MDLHRASLTSRLPSIAPALAALAVLGTSVAAPSRAALDVTDGDAPVRAGSAPARIDARDLPALGNTPELDRPLLREVGDDYVRGGESGSPATAPATADEALEPLEDAWGRVRAARRLEVPDNEAVRAQRRRLLDEALWIGKILRRADPYIAHVVSALDERYLPLELALLPAIESGFRPRALSHRRAAGLWQLMAPTALEFGVPRDRWYDGRGDVVVSTRAALDYLSYLNAVFHGDWTLTLAAYNAGPGRVRRALERARAAGGASDFWSLSLPRETREYVPKFLALLSLLRTESGDALDVPHVPLDVAGFVEVDARRRIDLAQAARLSGASERVLGNLNAGLVHGVTPPDGPHRLNLPHGTRRRFLRALARTLPRASPSAAHVVVAGDTLGAIARRYGLETSRLQAMNGLTGSLIRVGQRLDVRGGWLDGGARLEHVVSGGETLSAIAQRYAVRVEDILGAAGERLDGDLIRPGQTLLIHLAEAGTG